MNILTKTLLASLREDQISFTRSTKAPQHCLDAADEIERLERENAALREAVKTGVHALRSYQYGNSAPDLAENVADLLDKLLAPSTLQTGVSAAEEWSQSLNQRNGE